MGRRYTFQVRRTMCPTCIYHEANPLDVEKLEAEVGDGYGGFDGYRICHYHEQACCRGFWERHGDKFTLGRMAKELGVVEFTDDAAPDPRLEGME